MIARRALRRDLPGPYQIQAAINAVRADALLFHAIRAGLLARIGARAEAALSCAELRRRDRTSRQRGRTRLPAAPASGTVIDRVYASGRQLGLNIGGEKLLGGGAAPQRRVEVSQRQPAGEQVRLRA